jgi:hypothetical protein
MKRRSLSFSAQSQYVLLAARSKMLRAEPAAGSPNEFERALTLEYIMYLVCAQRGALHVFSGRAHHQYIGKAYTQHVGRFISEITKHTFHCTSPSRSRAVSWTDDCRAVGSRGCGKIALRDCDPENRDRPQVAQQKFSFKTIFVDLFFFFSFVQFTSLNKNL